MAEIPPASDSHRLSTENKIAQLVSVNRALAEIPLTSDSHRSTTKVCGGVHAIPFLRSIDCGSSPSPSLPEWGVVHGTVQHMPQLYRKVAGSIHLGRTQRVFSRVPELNPRDMGLSYYRYENKAMISHAAQLIGYKQSNAHT